MPVLGAVKSREEFDVLLRSKKPFYLVYTTSRNIYRINDGTVLIAILTGVPLKCWDNSTERLRNFQLPSFGSGYVHKCIFANYWHALAFKLKLEKSNAD